MAKDEFGTNKNNLFDSEDDTYIETLIVHDKMVNVFASDSGQCYWFQWLEDGELHAQTCGTYNFDYKDEIDFYFKPRDEFMWEDIVTLKRQVFDLQREVDLLGKKKRKDDK